MAPKKLASDNEFVPEYLYLEDYEWLPNDRMQVQQQSEEEVERGVIVIDLFGE
jgi:hypothetical protein